MLNISYARTKQITQIDQPTRGVTPTCTLQNTPKSLGSAKCQNHYTSQPKKTR